MDINGHIYHKNFLADKLSFKKTIFEENRELLNKYKGIDLSSGYPQWGTPKFVSEALAAVTFEENQNHYSPIAGNIGLRNEIAKEYKPIFKKELDANKNVVIGEGGTGLIFMLFSSLIHPEDEVILIEPFFQYFYFNTKMAKAKLKTYEMVQTDGKWEVDFEKLESLFTTKTRLIVLNSPHNPTGKVFNAKEIDNFRKILNKFPDVLVLADEVYERCIFDKIDFPRIGTYEDMWHRTITIISAGKIFNVTGWRVGIAIADEPIINCLIAAQRAQIFCINNPSSAAVARLLPQGYQPYEGFPSYYEWQASSLQKSRDILVNEFKKFPQITVYPSNGGFFFIIAIDGLVKYIPKQYFYKKLVSDGDKPINCKYEDLENPEITPSEATFNWLAKEVGVNIIPMDSFYDNEGKSIHEIKGKNLLRVSVCAKPSSIEQALERLQKRLSSLN